MKQDANFQAMATEREKLKEPWNSNAAVLGNRFTSSLKDKKRRTSKGPPFLKTYIELSLVSEGHVDAASFFIEVNVTVGESEESVVFTHSNVSTWVPLGSALADEDVSSDDVLATEFLHAEAFAA